VSSNWSYEGFRRIGDTTPQTFTVVVIGSDDSVERVELTAGNQAKIEIESDSTIAIAGTTRETNKTAGYSWSVR
jgi:ssDNA-binding replication factor A large subunit